MILLFLFSRRRITNLGLSISILVAAAASISSLQGLILWPVGFLCLIWRTPGRTRLIKLSSVWVSATAGCSFFYFWNFRFGAEATGGGSVSFALRHPVEVVRYFFIAIGNLFPVNLSLNVFRTVSEELAMYECIGVVIFAVAVFVVWASYRRYRAERRVPLPAALILFAVCFDISIALGRVSLGLGVARSSRYTMANLLMLVAIASYYFGSPILRAAHADKRAWLSVVIPETMIAVVLVAQIWVTVPYGYSHGKSLAGQRNRGAQVVVNLAEGTPPERAWDVYTLVYPGLPAAAPLLREAKKDQLSVFYPPLYRYYRHLGFPR
jgi:hypothetical protein